MRNLSGLSTQIVLGLILAVILAGCNSEPPAKTETYYKKGETLILNENYVLSDIRRAPQYDAPDRRGYAVIFLKETPKVPVRFSMGDSNPQPVSMVDFVLIANDEPIANINMEFSNNEAESAEYKGRVAAFFTLPVGQPFPDKGLLTYKNDNIVETDGVRKRFFDLSGIDITEAL